MKTIGDRIFESLPDCKNLGETTKTIAGIILEDLAGFELEYLCFKCGRHYTIEPESLCDWCIDEMVHILEGE